MERSEKLIPPPTFPGGKMSKHIKAAMPNQSNTWERVSKKYQKEAFLFFLASTILIVLAFFIGTAYADTPKPAIRKFRTTEIYGPPAPQLSIYEEKEIRRFYSTSTTTTTTTAPKPVEIQAPSSVAANTIPSKVTEPVVAQQTYSHADLMSQAGIPELEWGYVEWLVDKESGWNPNARNGSSGACGLGQQLPCGKWVHAWNDPIGGLIDMNSYVIGRYGSWAHAVAHSKSHGWY